MKNIFTLALLLIFCWHNAKAQTVYSQPITGIKQHLGATATVMLTIDLAAGHSDIIKPLIVAEGFDLGAVFSPENVNGMNTYKETFRTSLERSFSPELRNLIYENNKQYDIIYVDWNNGSDYLQRNAYALEEVIKWVNAMKVGTEQNVILGQSMGGVIARYALADMEQNMQQTGVDHQTRLFISHDAPHQGANIPVSLQFMYRHLNNQYVKSPALLAGGEIIVPIFTDVQPVSTYLSILDLPASKQLLSNSSNSNYTIDNFEHTTFYDELKAKGLPNSGGYPINCRNIAISNGAECGLGQGFNPADNLVNYNWNKGLTFGGDLLSMVYLPLGGVIGGRILDNDFYGVALAGLIPGKSKFDVEFNAKAMPYGTSNQIYKGKVSYTKKILWIGPNITVNITNVQKSQPAGILPLDTYGGGFYDTSIVAGSLTLPNLYVRDKFNFIPTTSALDIGKRNILLVDADYTKAYVGATPPLAPMNSPFGNFSTDFETSNPNSSNRSHISFNSRNGAWLARELDSDPITTNCSYICSSTKISGVDAICTSATYSAAGGATTYNWTITQGANLVTIAGNGTSTVTLTAQPNVSGQVTLSLTLGGTCGDVTTKKTITVGVPQFNSFTFGNEFLIPACFSSSCLTTGLQSAVINASFTGMSASEIMDNSNWEWERNNDLIFLNSLENRTQVCPIAIGSSNFKVRAKNACGWSDWVDYQLFDITECPFNFRTSATMYTIYPNPAKDIVNIELKDSKIKPEKEAIVSGTLFDLMGQSRGKVEIKNNSASLSVAGLKQGIYVLNINIDGKVEGHQVIVE